MGKTRTAMKRLLVYGSGHQALKHPSFTPYKSSSLLLDEQTVATEEERASIMLEQAQTPTMLLDVELGTPWGAELPRRLQRSRRGGSSALLPEASAGQSLLRLWRQVTQVAGERMLLLAPFLAAWLMPGLWTYFAWQAGQSLEMRGMHS